MATRMSGARAHRVLQVFYRDYVNAVSIPSSRPESLLANRLVPLADRLLGSADNFLGIVDRNDTILQCYLADAPGEVVLEIVYPEATGCLRLAVAREHALDLLDRLPDTFDENLLQGAQYID